jgi:hypothetical protein
MLNGSVDMRGLLLAGIIIGALGVLDDVTVTQASTVAELAPTATSRLELYRSATRIGRAHVASAVNTIVLAYAGASLPLLLLVTAGGRDVSDLLTSEFLAQEIVRSAVGTIGLVAAVPITTALATLVADIRRSPDDRLDDAPDYAPDHAPDHAPNHAPGPAQAPAYGGAPTFGNGPGFGNGPTYGSAPTYGSTPAPGPARHRPRPAGDERWDER